MNDTTVTLRGNVGGDVALRDVGDIQVSSFRLGATPRILNRSTGEWSDGVTQWYTVTAWRKLGVNAKNSLQRGDAVIVQGRLTVRDWVDKDGQTRTSFEVEADVIGHDLARGISHFTRAERGTDGAEIPAARSDEPWSSPNAVPAA